jgi:predicted DNA-binding protein (UPF0251 family)
MYRRRTIARRARVEFPIDINGVADLVASPGREAGPELNGLSEALARIPEAERRAIVLREWCGLSYREVAVEVGISRSAAEKLIARGRRLLAEELGGAKPTLRSRALSILSPLTSLKWLLDGGTTLKALAGATSIAILAVGSGRVVLHRHVAASPAVAAAQQGVLAMRAGTGVPRHAAARPRLRIPAPVPRPATHVSEGTASVPTAAPDPEVTATPEEPLATVAPEGQADREVTADSPAMSDVTAEPVGALEIVPVEDASQGMATPGTDEPAESSLAPDASGLQVLATETGVSSLGETQPIEPDPVALPPSDGAVAPGLAAGGPPGLAGGDPPGLAAGGPPGLLAGGPPAAPPEPPRHGPGSNGQDDSGNGLAQRLEHDLVDPFSVVDPILAMFDARPGVERPT